MGVKRVSHSKFSLNIKTALLRDDEHVSIIAAKRSVVHGSVGCVDVNSQTLFHGGISIANYGLEALGKVDSFTVCGNEEWKPAQDLRWKINILIVRESGFNL